MILFFRKEYFPLKIFLDSFLSSFLMKLYKKFYHVVHQDTVVRDCDDPLVRGIVPEVSQDFFF